ncbi:MAG: arsenate reductase ArsC [Acidobacteriota bacterium]
MKPRVLFLCTHNSARSQIAEALLRKLSAGEVDSFSAGSEASSVHPLAIRALQEAGIEIAGQRSKHLDEYLGEQFDYVVTVCDRANESCPIFPGAPRRLHWSIPDPSAVEGPEESRLQAFRAALQDLDGRIRLVLPEIVASR